MNMVEGSRSNRRWQLYSALKFKGLLWQPKHPTSGLGNRFHDPAPTYWILVEDVHTFNEAESLFIENHLQTLEMAHLWWKRKQGRVHAPNSQESMDRSFTGT